mgnify:CR=1 FL=1
MKHETIDYQNCIDLGFEHIHLGCEQFIKQYGYDWFTVDKRVMKQIYFTWDCNTRLMWMIRGGEKNVKARLPIYNIEHLSLMNEFFTIDN